MATKKREPANVETRNMQFLYKEAGDLVFMDQTNNEQVTISMHMVGDAHDLMKDDLPCTVVFFNERPVDITLPTYVQLTVTETEPCMAANTAAGSGTKKATVETGAVIDVPLFIRVGDTIKIDTRTRQYVGRVEGDEGVEDVDGVEGVERLDN